MKKICLSLALVSSSYVNAFTIGVSNDTAVQELPIYKEALDLVSQAYKKTKIDINYLSHRGDKTYMLVERGMIDAELYRISGLNDKYPHLYKIPFKLMNIGLYVYSISKNPNTIYKNNIINHSVAALSNYYVIDTAFKNNNFIKKRNIKELLSGLLRSEYEYILLVEYYLPELRSIDSKFSEVKFLRSQRPILSKDVYHYIHIKHKSISKKLIESFKSINISKSRYPHIHSSKEENQ